MSPLLHYKNKEYTIFDILARGISDAVNPMIVPPLIFGIIGYNLGYSITKISSLVLVAVLFFLVIPLFAAHLLVNKEPGRDFDFHDQITRRYLYIYSILSAAIGCLLIFDNIFSGYLERVAVIFLVNLIFAFLLNFKWKISVHSGSITVGLVSLLWLWWFESSSQFPLAASFIFLPLLPLVVWARLHLKVHSAFEIAGGIASGIIISTLYLVLDF